MRLQTQSLSFLLILCAAPFSLAATWGFEEATISVNKKGAGVGGGFKDKCGFSSPQASMDTQTKWMIQDRRKQSPAEACHSWSIGYPQDPFDSQRGQQSQKAASSLPSCQRPQERTRHIICISGEGKWEGQD